MLTVWLQGVDCFLSPQASPANSNCSVESILTRHSDRTVGLTGVQDVAVEKLRRE